MKYFGTTNDNEDFATLGDLLQNANITIGGNRTINNDGNDGFLGIVLDNEGSPNKNASFYVIPGNPNITFAANDGSGNIGNLAVGSANINITFTGNCDLRLDGQPGTAGQFIMSNGSTNAPEWKRPVEVLGAVYTTNGTAINTTATNITWSTVAPNTASITHSAGVFTIPAALDGYYLEFNISVGVTNPGADRANVDIFLELDTGSGFTTQITGKNYSTRNTTTLDEGGSWICGYMHGTAASTDDEWRVQILRSAATCDIDETATCMSIKAYPA